MNTHLYKTTGKFLLICLASMAIFTSCEPEDEDFFDFRPVTFFINASKLVIDEGQTITFEDRSINAVSREWVFTEGVPATSTEVMPTVMFPVAGDQEIFVTTTFEDGSTQRRRLVAEVQEPVVANFSGTPTALQKGGTVQFNNLTLGVGSIPDVLPAGDSTILYQWFIPGVTEDTIFASKPAIQFPETGTYDVTLKVTRRSTGFSSTITKDGFIRVFDTAVTQTRNARFSRDGSAIFLSFSEPTGDLDDDLAEKLTLTSTAGGTVSFTGAEKPAWSDHMIQLNVDPSAFTVGQNYRLTFTDVGELDVASGSVVLPFDYGLTFLGEDQQWANHVFSQANPNDPVMATIGGKPFTFDLGGITFSAAGRTDLSLFATGAAEYTQTYHTMNSPYSVQIVPGIGASLGDLGDVGVEIAFLSGEGSTHTFSQPVTDVRFHNLGGFARITSAVLSADGRTLTLTDTPPRNPNLAMSVILEGQIAPGGLILSTTAEQGVTVYTTASAR